MQLHGKLPPVIPGAFLFQRGPYDFRACSIFLIALTILAFVRKKPGTNTLDLNCKIVLFRFRYSSTYAITDVPGQRSDRIGATDRRPDFSAGLSG